MHRPSTTTQHPPPVDLHGATSVGARSGKEKQNSNMTNGPGIHPECKPRVKSPPPSSRWETCCGPLAQQVPRDGSSQTMQPQAMITSPHPSYSVPQATTPTPSSTRWETRCGPPGQQAPRDDPPSTMLPQAIVTSPPPHREPQANPTAPLFGGPRRRRLCWSMTKTNPMGNSIQHLSVGQPFLSKSFQQPLLVRRLVQTA